MNQRHPARVHRRRWPALVVVAVVVAAVTGWAYLHRGLSSTGRAGPSSPAVRVRATTRPPIARRSTAQRTSHPDQRRPTTHETRPRAVPRGPAGLAWPTTGEAALAVAGHRPLGVHGGDRRVPIASLAKMMTVYLVLRHHPDPARGLSLVVGPALVRDTAIRRSLGQSIVTVRAGERLTQNQMLTAILLPSANNIAVAIAVRDAGSVPAFVREMNETATALGMRSTHYTDPSGYSPSTVSTATDQLTLMGAAARIPTFIRLAGLRAATIPVAGRILNTDTLVGHDGFVAGKTGSHLAAGGCFAFIRRTIVATRPVLLTGVVMGQYDGPLIAAGLRAAKRLADSVGPPAPAN